MKALDLVVTGTEYTLVCDPAAYPQDKALSLAIDDIVYNSALARENTVFFCLVGFRTDGHRYAAQAYEKGCRVFVCEHTLPLPTDAVQLIVDNARLALAEMSANFFDHPERRLKIIGVTGTKGKSSVCEMLRHIFTADGHPTATIGTIGIRLGDCITPTENSTPESYVLYRTFAEMLQSGVEYVAMEVSSQAMYLDRVHGIDFAAAVMTNLYEDHIGTSEHPSFEHYKACKRQLMSRTRCVFLNADDAYADEFAACSLGEIHRYGLDRPAETTADNIENHRSGSSFGIAFDCYCAGESAHVRLPVPGRFSVYNALAAIAVAQHFGIAVSKAAEALSTVRVPGRFEVVPTGLLGVTCIIDYAHNGKSLTSALSAIREFAPRRIVCVFGSVGGRTKNRRRELAEAAGTLADLCIVTSDNPNFESPSAIVDDIASYIPAEKCCRIPDRREAIHHALQIAQSGDFLLFAGKGHEQYQLINGQKLPFSERDEILAAAHARLAGNSTV